MRITLHQGDITELRVDAIVNAASPELAPGGGVCGAIHRAAGPELAKACALLGGCQVGSAKVTGGGNLPAPWVIHAVGPIWRGGDHDEDLLLVSAYTTALIIAESLGMQSIAFPCISTGIYGFPADLACHLAVYAVRRWSKALPTDVVFCVFSKEDAARYRRRLEVPHGTPIVHNIKSSAAAFADQLSGTKAWEIRLNDRDYRIGDTLILNELDAAGHLTGRRLGRLIVGALHGPAYGLAEGWVILSTKAVPLEIDPEAER